jgi:O-antigen/teichoic acid export membrane protein
VPLINSPEIATIPKQTADARLAEGFRRLLERLEIDRAIVFVLLTRGWQALAGLVSLLLIARYFSPEVQGFYYTFASLLALQSFVELGFYLVIINVASHEWAHLGLDSADRIVGNPDALSRLVSLGRFIFKWYAAASILFIIGAGLAGHVFFSQAAYSGIRWQAPWWSVVALSGVVLWSLPLNSLLEGCNQVASINRFRLIQAMLSSVALWLTIMLDGGLWATVALAATNVLCACYLLLVRYRRFFEPFFTPLAGARIHWRTEIWPMQWRLALQGLVNYFMYSLFNPVMFHYHGAVVAGQMGMTWQVVSTLQLLALAWVQTKVPRYGMLIARKDYAALDHLWRRTSLVSLAFISGGGGAVWLLVYGLNVLQVPLAQRLLGPLPTGLFLLAVVLTQIIQCQAAYLRAHKKEPLVVSGVASGLAIGLLVWELGSRFGAIGAAVAYLLVTAIISLPMVTIIWFRSRAEWHQS